MARTERQDGIEAAELDAILRSHDIDPVAMRQDDFPAYFNRRFERLLKQIEQAMGKPVNRSADAAESPYAEEGEAQAARASIEALIAAGESKVVEFKSTGRKNVHTGQKDPAMEWGVVKTIAGSMNSHGDTLLVGVNDDGAVVGLQQNYPMLKKGDRDGWALWLTDMLSTCLAKVAASEIQLSFAELDGGDVARVDVGGAPQPVYAARSKGKKHQFLVRINNSTQELHGPEMLSYKDKRWPQ